MFDEMERLRDEKALFTLLAHYAALAAPDRQLWQDRLREMEGVEGRRAGAAARRAAGLRLAGAEHGADAGAASRRGAGVLSDHGGGAAGRASMRPRPEGRGETPASAQADSRRKLRFRTVRRSFMHIAHASLPEEARIYPPATSICVTKTSPPRRSSTSAGDAHSKNSSSASRRSSRSSSIVSPGWRRPVPGTGRRTHRLRG